jgi:hypothetical protein
MRSKVLELLFKVLETSSVKNIFSDTINKTVEGCPINVLSLYTRFNLKGKGDLVKIERLNYTIKFKEDEPEINVDSLLRIKKTNEVYKTKFFGLFKYYTDIYHYSTDTKIRFGDYSFFLTPEEQSQLIEATKQSYAKYLIMSDKIDYNKELLLKVHRQLGYYGGARDN